MKKICYVVTIPLTIRAFFIPQLQYLSNRGFDITVVCSKDDQLQSDLGEHIKYVPVEMPRGMSLGVSCIAIWNLVRLFRKEKFDMIQYSTPNAALYASVASALMRVKIRNYHLMGYRYLGANGIGRVILKMLEKFTCKLSTHIECVSASNLQLGLEEKIFNKHKSVVVWNGSTGGVDINRFNYKYREQWKNEIRKKLGILPEDFLFGYVGRITKDKGINEILEAFGESLEESKLLLVGNQEGIKTLDAKLWEKAQINPNIYICNSVSDIEKYYAAIDVLLLPSYREGFGNVVIEAAAMGTPAIVSEIPGPVDAIIPNETAFTVPAKNASQLKIAMVKMKKEKCDEMGKNAERYARECFENNQLHEFIYARKCELMEDINSEG